MNSLFSTTETLGGTLVGVYVGQQKGEDKSEVAFAEFLPDHGLRGDSHAGRDARRQVSLFAQETLTELLAEGFNVTPGQLSANLFTASVNLNSLKPGTQLRIGAALLEIVEPRTPCRNITRIDNRLPKRLYGQCGQLARILEGGTVHLEDAIEVVKDDRQLTLTFS
ncbi:MAG: MOSC domain-containing protein [Blastocatellia bacterium]